MDVLLDVRFAVAQHLLLSRTVPAVVSQTPCVEFVRPCKYTHVKCARHSMQGELLSSAGPLLLGQGFQLLLLCSRGIPNTR